MKDHVASVHTLDTPYKCKECDRAYPTRNKLYTHRLNDHQEKYVPKKCDWPGNYNNNYFHRTMY